MRCHLRYRHPVTHNEFYFVDFRCSDNDELRPVGCMRHRVRFATIFETKHDAMVVALELVLLGFIDVRVVKADA